MFVIVSPRAPRFTRSGKSVAQRPRNVQIFSWCDILFTWPEDQHAVNRPDDADPLEWAARAAWLYYVGGLKQSEVANRLGISAMKVHRLIARATEAGLVTVSVDATVGRCMRLAQQLLSRFGLTQCDVVPKLEGLPFQAVGTAAGRLLTGAIEAGTHPVIGLGHGRSVATAVRSVTRVAAHANQRIVSLLGGAAQQRSSHAFDVVNRLATRTGSDAWVMPVPLVADTPDDAVIFRRQKLIARTLAMGAQSSFSLVGIGEVSGAAFLLSEGIVTSGDVAALVRAGAVGELLGHYYDARGKAIDSAFSHRIVGVNPLTLKGRGMIAVAAGKTKIPAIRAVLATGFLTGLVTDETTARGLLR